MVVMKVKQVLPVKNQVPLEGLYLGQNLQEMSKKIGRSLVISDFLTDKNGVIAKADEGSQLKIPAKLKNSSDWRLFQELMAQADVIISGGVYFKQLATLGKAAQDILYQFEPGKEFEKLGQWRLNAGYKTRSPDLAVVTRDLDFEFPEELVRSGRKIIIFTTDALASSEKARALINAGTLIIGSGETNVEGRSMTSTLGNEMGYRVIMMASGPGVLEILLEAKCLDILYLTQVQVEIPFGDPATVRTLLPGGKQIGDLKEFGLSHQFEQEKVVTEDGSLVTQFFLRYDRKEFREPG